MLDDPGVYPPPGSLSWPDVQRHILLLQLFGVIFLEITKVLMRGPLFSRQVQTVDMKNTMGKTHIHSQKLPFHAIFIYFRCFFSVNLRDSNWCLLILLIYLTKNVWNTHAQGFAKDAWMIWIETVCIHRQVNAMCDRENPRRTGWPRVISQGDSTNLVRIESLGTSNLGPSKWTPYSETVCIKWNP